MVNAGCVCGGFALASRLGRSVSADEKRVPWPVTCRDMKLGSPVGQTDCWSALRSVGAEGVEVHVADDLTLPSLFHPTTRYTLATAAGAERLAADAKRAGQQITAFLMFNHFEQQPEAEVERCGRLARLAQGLGVPTIRIDVEPSAKLGRPELLKRAIETLAKVMAATESTGVTFAIENHSSTTNDPVFLKALFDGVGSKRLGLTLDIVNFYWFGYPLSKVYEICELFAPRVFHTHCKNVRYPAEQREKQRPMGWRYAECVCPTDQGDTDYARVVAILRKAGYPNDLCLESVFPNSLAHEIRFLQRARNGISGK
jgi:sugar phosphate isomerase/epimerase